MTTQKPKQVSQEVYTPPRLPNGHFRRGYSGNPEGRPKLAKEVKEMLAGLTPLAVQALADGLNSEDERVRMVAAQQILDRVLGKPQSAEKDASGGNNSLAHLQALLALAAGSPKFDSVSGAQPSHDATEGEQDNEPEGA